MFEGTFFFSLTRSTWCGSCFEIWVMSREKKPQMRNMKSQISLGTDAVLLWLLFVTAKPQSLKSSSGGSHTAEGSGQPLRERSLNPTFTALHMRQNTFYMKRSEFCWESNWGRKSCSKDVTSYFYNKLKICPVNEMYTQVTTLWEKGAFRHMRVVSIHFSQRNRSLINYQRIGYM